MPRYKQIAKKKSALAVHPWLRVGIIVAAVALVIILATKVVKRIVSHMPPIYGATAEDMLLSKRALVSKVVGLQTTIDSYNAQISTVSQLQSENAALKAELGRTPAPTGVLAHVMTLPNRSFYNTVLLDGGNAEGIHESMVAYAFNSIAIGTVSSVTAHTATVQLYSATGRQTTGSVIGSDVAVTLFGRGGGEYEVQLPRDVPLDVGAAVSMQSVNVATLATIEKIVTDPRDPFQRLLAKVPVNLQALKWVIVR